MNLDDFQLLHLVRPPAAGEDIIIMKIIYFDRQDIYADIFSVMEATALDLINEISGYI